MLQRIAESLPPPRHKSSTDEVFSEPQRLHKILASCGFGSRRAMEELIIAGRITVNRMPADVGQKVGPGDEVRINGEPVKIRFTEPKPRMLIYHKPTGELVTRDDPEERPTVFEDLPRIQDGKWIAIGRLDYNTEGLLMFTNSGELANRLMHPRYEVEREYAVRVMGRLSDEQLNALVTGVELEDGPAKCERIEDGGGDEDSANHWYNVSIKEGRNREVRRLFEALGLTVSRLIRTRYGRISMPPSLKRGEVLELEPHEVNALLKSIGLKPNAGAAGEAGPGARQPGKPRQPGGAPGQGQGGAQRHGQRSRQRGPQGVQGPGQGNGGVRPGQGPGPGQRGEPGMPQRPARGKQHGKPGRRGMQGPPREVNGQDGLLDDSRGNVLNDARGDVAGDSRGNRSNDAPGRGRGRPGGNAPRPPTGNAKRHGARPGGAPGGPGAGKGKPAGKGKRQGPRYAPDNFGNVLQGAPGAAPHARAGKGGAKRRPGRAKPYGNAQAHTGVARDRRVGLKPLSANDGRVPNMPVVTHKKRRLGTLKPEGATVPPSTDRTRDEDK